MVVPQTPEYAFRSTCMCILVMLPSVSLIRKGCHAVSIQVTMTATVLYLIPNQTLICKEKILQLFLVLPRLQISTELINASTNNDKMSIGLYYWIMSYWKTRSHVLITTVLIHICASTDHNLLNLKLNYLSYTQNFMIVKLLIWTVQIRFALSKYIISSYTKWNIQTFF